MDILNPPQPVTLRKASLYWLKLGFISFGGPAGQIAIMHRDLVEQKRWISEARFLHALNFCMVLPGPEAQQLATYIGWLMHRRWGGLIAGGLFVLPSFFMLAGLSWIYLVYGSVPAIAGILHGIKPPIVAVVLFAAWRIGSKTLRNKLLWAISASAFLAVAVAHVPFPIVILTAALAGHLGGRLAPHYFTAKAVHANEMKHPALALLDDSTPVPAHAKFTWLRLWGTGGVGMLIWVISMGTLSSLFGWQGALTQMAWFFTKAALLTFGGAYAVLPYVYQAAVEHYQWLTPDQMIDGLALGETTPGPLIMIVTFVGFVAGWTTQTFGAGSPLASACAGAVIVTFFTFLPSFIFIFMGGPFVETTHGNLRFTAPLTSITAAVVGVILNLAVFFAYHVFWPRGLDQGVDFPSLGLAAVATIAIFRFKVGMIPVIIGCGLLGMVFRLFG